MVLTLHISIKNSTGGIRKYCYIGLNSFSLMRNTPSNYMTGSVIITAFGEGSFRFFGDIQRISYDLIGEGSYTNCSNKNQKN